VDLKPLLAPRSIAVVGATDRPGAYGDETLRNLQTLGFPGPVWGVHPTRTSVHGRTCVASVADLPEPVDAVVVAIPAAGVPEVIEQAGARGCGGAVVYGAGFGEAAGGAALEAQLRTAAARHDLPVCGPNCDGIVALHERAALWGDALVAREPGHVALVSQSGNLAVNALASARGLRLHTVVSSGNQALVGSADWLEALAGRDGVRSVALFLEADGDGARLCEALARCAEAGVGVAVLKIGASRAGASAAAAHTGAVAGDHAAFRALVQEAGAAWAHDVHELLELAKVLAVDGARPESGGGGGLAILTCSGGDSGLGADEAERRDLALPAFAPATHRRLLGLLPAAATVANPLDYTALIWGEVAPLRDTVAAVGADPSIGQVLVFYDQPPGLDGEMLREWDAVREGIRAGADIAPVPVLVASTLPELLDDAAAWELARAGVAAVAGLRTGLACAAALRRAPADPARLRAIAAAIAPSAPGEWLDEVEAKALVARAGIAIPPGRVVGDEDEAAAAAARLARPVALKLVARGLHHKTDTGAIALGLEDERAVRWAYRDLLRADGERRDTRVLVEAMAPDGVELLVSARRDAVVPVLTVGLGGVWTEALADAAVIPLPADAARVERALRTLRAAPLLEGARGGPALDVAGAARLAARVGELLLAQDLELLELNPVRVHARGAVALDALARAGRHPDQEGQSA
jgi:acetate---CoA ligase (ADP-forming)